MKIEQGHSYRAKKPRNARGFYNDRQVLRVTEKTVQYDSPSVGFGRKYPTIPKEQFMEWAAQDVTDILPKHEWQVWP